MTKPHNNEFLSNLLMTLNEFHKWQLDHTLESPPYTYDTLGLAEWLEFDKSIEVEVKPHDS